MIALVRAEVTKLLGSLALLLAVAAPALPALLVLLGMLGSKRTPTWNSVYLSFALPVWSLFLMPMTIAAFVALVGQIEHRSRGWDHLLALPIRRWQLFAAKLIVTLGVIIGMTALMLAFATGAAALAGAIRGAMPLGAIPWDMVLDRTAAMLVASAAFSVILLWTALRFASFVVPLGIGIAGVLVALSAMITRTDKADYFPWLLQVKVFQSPNPWTYALIGGVAGAVIAVAMVAAMARHSFR
ncbi:ABC transporter permease [uncultured Sphingomonas sp.]|uniref:ABC transporter permease n=1 Tax=uncultured Sphingomonas sp. TaxID=158754 RepID=UPI003747E7D8